MQKLLLLVSSQYKHLPGRTEADILPRVISRGSAMQNEPFSFQVLYRAEEGTFCCPVTISAVCGNLPIGAWRVDYVPVLHTANVHGEPGYESDQPGLFPDILMPRPAAPAVKDRYETDALNLLNATGNDYQSLWITVNPDSETLAAGEYTVHIEMHGMTSHMLLAEAELTLEIIGASLPENNIRYTNWFYEDTLCDTFDVELYSDKFYEIFDDYITNMTRHRQNTLLLPAFTPPLDTPVGSERMNVQLTDITRTADGWQFSFDRMRRFIRRAKKCGSRCFEHSHLFSQWGAEHAPNIYDTDGRRIFGFDTDAVSEEYTAFLRAYLTAFLAFAREEGITDDIFFHISDEPKAEQLPSYERAYRSVADLLDGYVIADAMSHIEFCEAGLVTEPIAHLRSIQEFEGKCGRFWLYYTGGSVYEKLCTNRLIPNTAARTRVLGLQLYHYNACGFLQWGYNFYYDRLSAGRFNPHSAPGGYKIYPGAAHLAYPVFGRGVCHAAPSVREKLMCEAIDDLRALRLLESLIGREATEALCEDFLGTPITHEIIPEGDALFVLRGIINQKIKECINK